MFNDFFKHKRVFITGHTGFKGSWLLVWLKKLGAEICGYSLEPPTDPNLYDLVGANVGIKSIHGDVRDFSSVKKAINDFGPEIVIHLAAQSLVRKSYADPMLTFSTNIMGTVNVVEAVRQARGVKAVLNVTSDKCYENKEWIWGYRENDPMGGNDPYSSSKGCSELITSCYLKSFFDKTSFGKLDIGLASARAGNVVGGGDFAMDRIIPDIVRSISKNESVYIRSPRAIRPWQHVLEPLCGYLKLSKCLYTHGNSFSGGWNFGPDTDSICNVRLIVEKIFNLWGKNKAQINLDNKQKNPHESAILKLDSSKARTRLKWKPLLNLHQSLEWTVNWYDAFFTDPTKLRDLTEKQIDQYWENR